jgi:hypothetical protein
LKTKEKHVTSIPLKEKVGESNFTLDMKISLLPECSNSKLHAWTITIADEESEISGSHGGKPSGIRAEMYENCGQNNFNLSLCLLRTTTPF